MPAPAIVLQLKNQTSPEVRRIASDFKALKRETDQALRDFDRLDRQFKANQRSALSLASAEARLAAAQGNTARATGILTNALSRQTQRTAQVINTERQLLNLRRQGMDSLRQTLTATRQVTTATGSLTSSLTGLQGVLGSVGVVLGAQQLLQFGASAIQSANSLERTKATVLALAGSQQRYNEVLATARQGQRLYGGTLEENLRGLGSLVNLSNRSGASLKQLDNVSRRLAIIDPLQGIQGANIALKEFLANDGAEAAKSLSLRFELPKTALRDLAQEGVSAKDRLAALDKLLNEQGITNQVLTNRVNTTATAYDRLSSSLSNAKDKTGAGLAERFEPAAQQATVVADSVAGDKDAMSGIIASQKALEEFGAATFNPLIQGLGAYNAAVLTASRSALEHIGILERQVPVAVGLAAITQAITNRVREASAALEENIDTTQQDAEAAALADAKSQLLTRAKEQLTNQAKAAADRLLESGRAGLDAAIKLANSSSLVDQLTYAYYQLGNAAATAGSQADARLNASAPGFIASHKQALENFTAAQNRFAIAQGGTATALKIARQELAKLTDPVDILNKKAEIVGLEEQLRSEQERGLKTAQQRLNLEERTADAKERQLKAALDMRLATIDDQRKKFFEAKELLKAQRVLSSPTASAEQKFLAQLRLQEIPLEQNKRALEIFSDTRDANGQIVNGKLIGGSGSTAGGLAPLPSAANVPITPVGAAGASAPVAAGGGGQVVVQFSVDGRVIAEQIIPIITESLTTGLQQAKAGGIGKGV